MLDTNNYLITKYMHNSSYSMQVLQSHVEQIIKGKIDIFEAWDWLKHEAIFEQHVDVVKTRLFENITFRKFDGCGVGAISKSLLMENYYSFDP